ncbi:hypothetical protein TrVE_jg631 [Triparma verrucosa]|uniref:Prokaryotic-type class I peptide chain release factors domain-containing protein n=1 Tax=Triparma verrucosa TaxID=1606542 RepID=A0A9W7FEX8_9STRA|nr:hypothetical protein TrVE_jg631 [Triparma verrucosa]
MASPRHLQTSSTSLFSLPENSYKTYTLDDDKLLWANRNLPASEQCELLGRGERSIAERLKSLQDVNSNGYKRLFTSSAATTPSTAETKTKLTPAGEILQRIKFDYYLVSSDYSVVVADRTEGPVEVPFDAENDSVSGSERQFVFAIPEHRISKILFKRRVVWDKERRLDLFGDIKAVQETYGMWLEEEQRRVQEREALASKFEGVSELLRSEQDWDESDVRSYVKRLVQYYENYNVDDNLRDGGDDDDGENIEREVLDDFKRLLSLTFNDDAELQSKVLAIFDEERQSDKFEVSAKQIQQKELPVLSEDDIDESFVKGGGAGGQKINKTASKVVLIHLPTGVTIATQKTRSLAQNRKIARKMLAEQVDVFLNGERSKMAMKGSVKSKKKSKAKAKARRNREKKAKEKEVTD